MSLLCETVVGRSMAELLARRDEVRRADLVELRLDGVADASAAGALAGRSRPAIVTCRPRWEGGRFDGSEEERIRILEAAFDHGADFVDVEWKSVLEHQAVRALVAAHPERTVLSMHEFSGVPNDLPDRVRAMRAVGARTIKVAVMPATLAATLPLCAIGRAGGAVVVGMGEAGIPSRLLAGRYGSCWTYAGEGLAPGQLPAARMLDEFRFQRVGAATRLFGVVSTRAMHSASPAMHNAAFEAMHLDAVYVPLPTADFDDFLEYAEALDIEGASVTMPFKRQALAAAAADRLAVSVGAANTLRRARLLERRPAGRSAVAWEATNTDVHGFLAPLEAQVDRFEGLRASILGAGGAARAAVAALGGTGAVITVHARRPEQARELTALGARAGPWPPPRGSWDLLVNCTPLGGGDERETSPVPAAVLDGRLVYDLTYGPGESALVREARAAGCKTLDGLAMLVAQAERQFEWWTGMPPGAGVMREAAERRLGRRPVAAAGPPRG